MFSRNPERSPVPGTTPVPNTDPAPVRPGSPAAAVPPAAPPQAGGMAIVTGVRDVAPAPGPALQAAVAAGTVIARTDRIEGTIRASEAIRILGSVEGRIEAAMLVVEEGARIQAEIVVDEAVVAGEIIGTVTCRQRLEVRPTGRITGQVETVRLMLHEGAAVDGEMRMLRTEAGEPAPARPSVPPPAAPAAPAAREGGVRTGATRAVRTESRGEGPGGLLPLEDAR